MVSILLKGCKIAAFFENVFRNTSEENESDLDSF